jgi:uncharacterized protein (DUF849 family)
MSLNMSREVFITCALTGSGDTTSRSDKVPRTPEEIANAGLEAAKAGAAVVHIHVRDPKTGEPSRDLRYYREVMERIRAVDNDVVINLTAGMGGDITLGSVERPLPLANKGTDMAGATERLEHVRELLPDICTIDCGTMNFGEGDYIMTNTPSMLAEMAKQVQALGVRAEIEVFDTGHLRLAKWLVDQGLIDKPVLVQLCMGIAWGAPDDINTLMSMVENLPEDWIFSAFSISRNQMPYVAMAALAGGNVRVGLEDNIWLDRGVLATNAQLVERAVNIIENMGSRVLTATEVRANLDLAKR